MEEIRRSPVEVGSLSYYIIYKLQALRKKTGGWLFGIYEPSTVPKLRPSSRNDGGSGGK